jgi:hypothetical protein
MRLIQVFVNKSQTKRNRSAKWVRPFSYTDQRLGLACNTFHAAIGEENV